MTENERVMKVRKALSLTMDAFGKRIGITKSAVGNIESGRRGLTEQMCRSICREFGIREEWLRTGEGAMMEEKPRDAEMAAKLDKILTAGSNDFRRRLITVLIDLPSEKWEVLEEIADKVKEVSSTETAVGEMPEEPEMPSQKAWKPWNEMTKEEKLAELSRQLDEEEATQGEERQSGGGATA